MRQIVYRFIILLLTLTLTTTSLWANNSIATWYSIGKDKKTTINVELYVSSTCPHCHKADEFFKKIEAQTPWLHVTRFVINEDKNALIRFDKLLNEQNMNDFAVPSVFFCDTRWMGFASAETTGKDLLYALDYCKQQIDKKGSLDSTSIAVLKRWANANTFDAGMVESPSTLHYIVVIALMDAYNPCALFSLITFFAILCLLEKRRDVIIAGLAYMTTIGLVHYLQQAQTTLFFQGLPWLQVPAIAVGLFTLLMFWYHRKGVFSLKLGLLNLILFVFMVHSYQQTCVMNWSFIFEQWLFNQHLTKATAAWYELGYQLMYLFPLLLTLVLYLVLVKTDRIKQHKPYLVRVGVLNICLIALILIIYPWALSSFNLSIACGFLVGILGWFINRN